MVLNQDSKYRNSFIHSFFPYVFTYFGHTEPCLCYSFTLPLSYNTLPCTASLGPANIILGQPPYHFNRFERVNKKRDYVSQKSLIIKGFRPQATRDSSTSVIGKPNKHTRNTENLPSSVWASFTRAHILTHKKRR